MDSISFLHEPPKIKFKDIEAVHNSKFYKRLIYDELLASLQKMVVLGFVKQHNLDLVLVDTTVEGLLCKMDDFKAPDKAVW